MNENPRRVWLDDVVDKLAIKHHVNTAEVEQVLNNRLRFRFAQSGTRMGEDLDSAFGQTDAGRSLAIFFLHKRNRRALILSARKMTGREKTPYAKK